jgi:asparagine synthase (glutamine-hydrolysing)
LKAIWGRRIMCGIFGVINFSGRYLTSIKNDVELGKELIRHRGPDGDGTWFSDDYRVGFSHVRLAIIDVETGKQPMECNSGRYTITFNGEIYNFRELRSQIRNYSFKTNSDTEVILAAFQEWGPDCVRRLNGMFAFAIYDNVTREVFIARDRAGIKPLYYHIDDDRFIFASEIKALTPFLAKKEVDDYGLKQYFTYQYCIGTQTLFKSVQNFPLASYGFISLHNEAIKIEKYWTASYTPNLSYDDKYIDEKFEDIFSKSVRSHLISDVEVGAYVSGGIDSSLVGTYAAAFSNAEQTFKCFNGRFKDDGNYDESHYALQVTNAADAHLVISEMNASDFVDNFSKIIWHLDQPTAGPGSFPQYLVSQSAAKHVKAVLGGQGGDELFGGYTRYLVAYLEETLKMAIKGQDSKSTYGVSYQDIASNLTSLGNYIPLLKEFWSEGLFDSPDKRYFRLINRSNNLGSIVKDEFLNSDDVFTEFQGIYKQVSLDVSSSFDAMTHVDFSTLLPALLTVEDRMSMAHGIESRVPFLDNDIIDFANSIPSNIKYKNGKLKRVLTELAAHKLPEDVVQRKDKMGFPVPINDWLRSDEKVREFVFDHLKSTKARNRNYLIDGFSFETLLSSQHAYSRNIWGLLSLELWHQEFIG